MTTTTDTDLKELKDLILNMDKSINLKISEINTQISDLNTKISDLDRKVDAKFYELDKKIDNNFYELDKKIDHKFAELDKKIEVSTTRTEVQFKSLEKEIQDLKKQVDKQDTRLWVTISGLFIALFGAIARGWLSSSNP